MKRIFIVLFIALFITYCNNNPPEGGTEGTGGSQQYPVNFDSTYKLCTRADTLSVRITDTAGGQVYYIVLPDSTQGQKSATEFINAVNACFPQ